MWLELLFVGAVLVLSAAQQTKHPQDGGPNGPGHKKRSRSQVVAMAAVRDYKRAYRDSRRTGTLCATFLDTTVAGELSMLLLAQNVAVSVRDGVCTSWAVLAYQCDPGDVDDTTALKQRLEGRVKSPLALVHCAPARSNKALLYRDLLPAITEASERGAPFRRVWLLDEDMSFDTFDAPRFRDILDCAFFPRPPPVVVQTTVKPSTQKYQFLNTDEWQSSAVVVMATAFVELQLPLFDAVFFTWFVENVVAPLEGAMRELDTLWGIDELFCKSAGYFDWHARGNVTATWTNATSKAQTVTVTLHSVPCAVITAPEVAMRHNNLRTIDKVTLKFRKRGFKMKNVAHNMFPRWAEKNIVSVDGTGQLTHRHLNRWERVEGRLLNESLPSCRKAATGYG